MNKLTNIISTTNPYSDSFICNALLQALKQEHALYRPLVFFCIGTNHVTGDALGPLIGSFLEELHLPNTHVYGTWHQPVHALNLYTTWINAKKKHPDACFIAIDASFGPPTHLGNIFIENRPLNPGQGVGKELPSVGNISITGIVCPDCIMRHRQLTRTPLSTIQHQANVITSGIFQTILHLSYLRKLFTDSYTP